MTTAKGKGSARKQAPLTVGGVEKLLSGRLSALLGKAWDLNPAWWRLTFYVGTFDDGFFYVAFVLVDRRSFESTTIESHRADDLALCTARMLSGIGRALEDLDGSSDAISATCAELRLRLGQLHAIFGSGSLSDAVLAARLRLARKRKELPGAYPRTLLYENDVVENGDGGGGGDALADGVRRGRLERRVERPIE